MTDLLHIKIILASTRRGRYGEKPAHWMLGELQKQDGVAAELLDLRDYPLPFFDEPVPPSMIKEPYANPAVQTWTKKIAEADAFIIVTPEYNHGYPAVLKNALDYVYKEWNNKPVGFVGYGSVLGARAIEQLRGVAVELQMAPIRNAVHIPWAVMASMMNEPTPVKPELFEPMAKAKDGLISQLLWWGKTLKHAREGKG
jgi:NAD(P)H-dependent FMN reductase